VEPTVCAIITTYNYGRFIAGGIESVLRQTIRPDEIVVVDDGSTDDTGEIVARYAADGVRYIRKQNGGAGSARNAGIRATSAAMIAFLDADDRWVPEKVARQLEHFRRYPAAGLVTASEWQVREATGEKRLLSRKPVGAARLFHEVLIENFIGNPSLTMIRRACFDKVGLFDEGLRLGQDWEMWIRIAREFPVGVVEEPLLLFNFHSGSLTAGQVQGRADSNREIRRRYISTIKSPLTRLNLMRAATSMSHYYTAAGIADDPAHRWPALRAAAAAFALDPLYETRLKAALLVRVAFGRGFFNRLRDLTSARKPH
jgi:glycosyltransferase involved in cell wall biosynthesis